VARNRKRAKERRARRPAPVGSAGIDREDEAPSPIEHASPDVELAEAQLAVGRPEFSDQPEPEDDDELESEALAEDDLEPEDGLGSEDDDGGDFDGQGPPTARSQAPVPAGGAVPDRRQNTIIRLIGFLQGSWRELQRVQWPDRRQVMQATGVVIGFVIVAGVFLGVADFFAGKLVNFILK
jgi:preprotein translocase subunit SecE